MARIGLDDIYIAEITENEAGEEEYGTPEKLSESISVEMEVEIDEAQLFASNRMADVAKEFKSGTITINTKDIPTGKESMFTGAEVDQNGVMISSGEDVGKYVAIGTRTNDAKGKWRYFWFYRVKFNIPSISLQTKGDKIEFKTPTIVGTFMQRNKVDSRGKHPWKADVREGDAGVTAEVLDGWYDTVYEPSYAEA